MSVGQDLQYTHNVVSFSLYSTPESTGSTIVVAPSPRDVEYAQHNNPLAIDHV